MFPYYILSIYFYGWISCPKAYSLHCKHKKPGKFASKLISIVVFIAQKNYFFT